MHPMKKAGCSVASMLAVAVALVACQPVDPTAGPDDQAHTDGTSGTEESSRYQTQGITATGLGNSSLRYVFFGSWRTDLYQQLVETLQGNHKGERWVRIEFPASALPGKSGRKVFDLSQNCGVTVVRRKVYNVGVPKQVHWVTQSFSAGAAGLRGAVEIAGSDVVKAGLTGKGMSLAGTPLGFQLNLSYEGSLTIGPHHYSVANVKMIYGGLAIEKK